MKALTLAFALAATPAFAETPMEAFQACVQSHVEARQAARKALPTDHQAALDPLGDMLMDMAESVKACQPKKQPGIEI